MDADTKYSDLANYLIPQEIPDFQEIENRYPERNLPADALVTRVAPSPTGFTHLGLIFASMINEKIAQESHGLFFLRIEDTDKNREVEGGALKIAQALQDFDIHYQEGLMANGQEVGDYGPYIQSRRQEIYLSAARKLISSGHAYPCFCTEEHLSEVRATQEAAKVRPGYYGHYATCRNLTLAEVQKNIASGLPYVLRFRSPEDSKPSTYIDSVKGKITLPENDLDYVIFKSAEKGLGLPVYHFAAMVDDHLQKVNQVVRGDEWLSSLPVHLQIIAAFGWVAPKFGHLSPIVKMDGPTTKRKLSKRKDPEAAATFYLEQGIPSVAVKAYVFNIASSKFEDWRRANQSTTLDAFPFSLNHMGSSVALFDMVKFSDISKQEISLMSAEAVYSQVASWAKEYNPDFYQLLIADVAYSQKLFAIERSGDKKRKDIASWSQVPDLFGYFYDSVYNTLTINPVSENITDSAIVSTAIKSFLNTFDTSDSKEIWLEKLKQICTDLDFAANMKDYKTAPENYKGHLGDVAMVLRLALSGRPQTPDLYEMLRVLGKDRVFTRLNRFTK